MSPLLRPLEEPLSKEDLEALDALKITHPNLWRHFRECGQAVLMLEERQAALAELLEAGQAMREDYSPGDRTIAARWDQALAKVKGKSA